MLKAKRCIVWGIGNEYEKLLNQLLFEIYKGNISIEALVCRKEDKYCSTRDGFPVITKEELKRGTFDYIIITSVLHMDEIKREASVLVESFSHLINGQVFLMPLFDFNRYAMLIENPVTILSDDCWGGYAYHCLKLPFSSPLINIYWNRDEYAKFIENPLFYLNSELDMVEEGDLEKGIPPVGQLGDAKQNVKMIFTHNVDFMEGKRQWDRRKQRINPDNLFIKMGFNVADTNRKFYIEKFKEVPYNKILVYLGEENVEGIFKTKRFIWLEEKSKRVEFFQYNDYFRASYLNDLDLLKLLTGDKSYSRYI